MIPKTAPHAHSSSALLLLLTCRAGSMRAAAELPQRAALTRLFQKTLQRALQRTKRRLGGHNLQRIAPVTKQVRCLPENLQNAAANVAGDARAAASACSSAFSMHEFRSSAVPAAELLSSPTAAASAAAHALACDSASAISCTRHDMLIHAQITTFSSAHVPVLHSLVNPRRRPSPSPRRAHHQCHPAQYVHEEAQIHTAAVLRRPQHAAVEAKQSVHMVQAVHAYLLLQNTQRLAHQSRGHFGINLGQHVIRTKLRNAKQFLQAPHQ